MIIDSSCAAPAGVSQLRRVYAAPHSDGEDVVDLLVTTNQPYLLHYQAMRRSTTLALVKPSGGAAAPPPSLASPARDVAWCPFKKGKTNAAYFAACRSQPLQLYDLYPEEDEPNYVPSVRCAYTCLKSNDMPCDPSAVSWLHEGRSGGGHVFGGYGGAEDAAEIRCFDVLVEGNHAVWTYSSLRGGRRGERCGRVSTLCEGKVQNGVASVLLAGYFDKPYVEVVDLHNRCCAASLNLRLDPTFSLSNGCMSLCAHPSNEFLVFVGGRCAASSVLCWDLRRPLLPLHRFHRPVGSNERCELTAVASCGGTHDLSLCTTSPDGVQRFSLSDVPGEGEAGQISQPQTALNSLGPASGIAAVSTEGVPLLAVASGSTQYGSCHRRSHVPESATGPASKRMRSEGPSCMKDNDSLDARFSFPSRRTAAAPLSSSSDVDDEVCETSVALHLLSLTSP